MTMQGSSITLRIADPDFASQEWETLKQSQRSEIRAVLNAVRSAPAHGISEWFRATAPSLDMKEGSLRKKYYDLRATGDWKVLIDKRSIAQASKTRTKLRRFVHELLRMVEENHRKSKPAFRELRRIWRSRERIIPGYEDWPGWPAIPEGWSDRNLAEIVKRETSMAALRSIRVGTSSKTNGFLPHVITTRVGLWPGAVIQLDDMWHDNYVTVNRKGRPVFARVLELAAMDLFSAHRFHWGCKPRLRRDDGTMENIGGRDGRLFLAGLLHRFGRCPRGMAFMAEHQTMSIPEDVERLMYDYSGGWIRTMRQAIEGKQAALTGYWSGSEGGNFRAKALIESSGNLIHNDAGRLPMQTGSPSSGLLGPVTTERHREWMAKAIEKIAKINPKRLAFLRTGTGDFHAEFIPFLTDYYEHGLGRRTDHELEGWEELDLFTNEYTLMPGSDQWIPEELVLGDEFDAQARAMILAASRSNPSIWKRRRRMSPWEVWQTREQWLPVPPALICEILTGDLAREVTAKKGFLTFEDKDLSPFPLIYEAKFISGPRAGERIGHGEKVLMFALPFDDSTALAVDARGRFLGELPLARRVQTINPSAFGSDAAYEDRPDIVSDELKRAAGRKHEAIAEILEPVRIRHIERVQEAQDLRAAAKRLADPSQAVTDEEIAAARDTKRIQRDTVAAADLAEEALANVRPPAPFTFEDDDLDF